jgi:hypothetical protein
MTWIVALMTAGMVSMPTPAQPATNLPEQSLQRQWEQYSLPYEKRNCAEVLQLFEMLSDHPHIATATAGVASVSSPALSPIDPNERVMLRQWEQYRSAYEKRNLAEVMRLFEKLSDHPHIQAPPANGVSTFRAAK